MCPYPEIHKFQILCQDAFWAIRHGLGAFTALLLRHMLARRRPTLGKEYLPSRQGFHRCPWLLRRRYRRPSRWLGPMGQSLMLLTLSHKDNLECWLLLRPHWWDPRPPRCTPRLREPHCRETCKCPYTLPSIQMLCHLPEIWKFAITDWMES